MLELRALVGEDPRDLLNRFLDEMVCVLDGVSWVVDELGLNGFPAGAEASRFFGVEERGCPRRAPRLLRVALDHLPSALVGHLGLGCAADLRARSSPIRLRALLFGPH